MKSVIPTRKNLTRFTYKDTAFQGWRVCIIRNGKTFVKYFSDKKLGSEEASKAAAEELLDKIESVLKESVQNQGVVSREAMNELSALIGK